MAQEDRRQDPDEPEKMIDFPSVSLSGAIEIARARVLWHEGTLRAYTKNGLVFETLANAPVEEQTRWQKRFVVQSSRGMIVMKPKCSTCGGWKQVTRKAAFALWEEP